jgi:hypothetical protein
MATNTHRQPPGTPTGGQFAAGKRGRATVNLDPTPPPASGPSHANRLASDFTDINHPDDVAQAIAGGIDPRLAAHTRRGNELFDQTLRFTTNRARQGRWNDAQAEIDSLADPHSTGRKTSQGARVHNARAALAEMRRDASRSTDPDIANPALSPRLAHPGDRTAFQIKDGACYELRRLTPGEAADKGCPTATHALRGRHEERLGRVEVATGRISKVPGWSSRKGLRASFVCDDDPGFEPLPGYVGQ